MTLYRRELVDLDSEEGVMLMDCLTPAILNDGLRTDIEEVVKRGKKKYGMDKKKDDMGNVDKEAGEVQKDKGGSPVLEG